ncbi:MAG: HigA family addiction module antitoxin [Trueperaceae bacterium]
MTQKALAARLKVSYPKVNELVHGKRGITPDTALRLARLFRTSPEFWLNGQLARDLYHAMRSSNASQIDEIEPVGTV